MNDEFQRNNFKKPYKSAATCAQGSVAVGVVLYYNTDHTYPAIEGIALECASVSVHEYIYEVGTTERVTNTIGGQ